ncbi:MAG TPA: serine hydroxymethyltransferase, partial [Candidatus Bilamarchaeaceae archaeon]|nr:serine hydroxymethyltransferase [Candidatus Bilamarchaeaceae archaeon]
GTETHLLLVDLTSLNITGKEAQAALEEAGIIVNKNTIPFDTKSPFVTSGIRIGTPSLTTRGMKESEMLEIAKMIVKILKDPNNAELKQSVRNEIEELCRKFPIYPELG